MTKKLAKKKKIVFLTGTRADFGKLKSLISEVENSPLFECHVFVTGMHMLQRYGYTYDEVRKQNFKNIYTFMNQTLQMPMDLVLANTISGFHNYVHEIKPDLIVVHGDRIEALACAIVSACNNILLAHIEGGEVSGTIDESIRHAITKFTQLHFVANDESRKRLLQMGEKGDSIFVIGSPDIDIMKSTTLPSLESVMKRYELPSKEYALFTYHPVTTELAALPQNIKTVLSALEASGLNYVGMYPNNDAGSDIIIEALQPFLKRKTWRILPSFSFEAYLTLLKNCQFIIGNSSAGIREAEVYGRPSINIGARQKNRSPSTEILNVEEDKEAILQAIRQAVSIKSIPPKDYFGSGDSAEKFLEILEQQNVFETPVQKEFQDNYNRVFAL